MTVLILILLAGATLTGVHILGGLLLTPFFGASPFFWSHVLASFPVSLSLGLLIGRPQGGAPRKGSRAAYRMAVVAGLATLALPLVLAPAARAVLDRNPDAALAPALAVLLLVTLPGMLAVAVIPRLARAAPRKADGDLKQLYTHTGPLLVLALGGTGGAALCAPVLLGGHDGWPWAPLWLLGGGLLFFGLAGLRPAGRIAGGAGGLVVVAAFFSGPNELGTPEYQKALEQSWQLRVGRYYLDTAGQRTLAHTEVLYQYEELRRRIAYAPETSVAAVMVVETLRGLGAVKISGDGLRRVLDLHLPAEARSAVMPLLERISSVTSDGNGKIAFSLDRAPDEDAIRVTLPAEDGGETTFELRDDFYLRIRVEEGAEESRTTLEVGPLEIERAGFLARNDTYRTPIVVKNVVLFFDAHLLGLTVVTRPEQVVVKVRGQGSIGAVRESTLQVIDLAETP